MVKLGAVMGMNMLGRKLFSAIFGLGKFFPLFEISGKDYFELGEQIGKNLKNRIQAGLKRRKKWIDEIKNFADADRKTRFEPFLDSLKQNFPHYLEEMKGTARGSELDFDLLFVLNLNPELSAMMRSSREDDCSTVLVKNGDKIVLGHNEDGSEMYIDLMSLLKVKAPSGIDFFVLAYPGIMPGNGPGINSNGILHTCNYIGNKKCKAGVPRYFIDRAMLEAKSMEDAIKLGSHPARAYSQAHNLVSISEKRAVMIESSISKVAVREVDGILYRTNNYILPEMQDEQQFASYQASSLPRLKSLEIFFKELSPDQVDESKVHQALSNHDTPFISPCRHKSKLIPGATLGTLLFDSTQSEFKIFYQAPCKNIFQKFPVKLTQRKE